VKERGHEGDPRTGGTEFVGGKSRTMMREKKTRGEKEEKKCDAEGY